MEATTTTIDTTTYQTAVQADSARTRTAIAAYNTAREHTSHRNADEYARGVVRKEHPEASAEQINRAADNASASYTATLRDRLNTQLQQITQTAYEYSRAAGAEHTDAVAAAHEAATNARSHARIDEAASLAASAIIQAINSRHDYDEIDAHACTAARTAYATSRRYVSETQAWSDAYDAYYSHIPIEDNAQEAATGAQHEYETRALRHDPKTR